MSQTAHFPWHSEPWQRISAARSAQRLPHAILLAGPPGLGKGAFARRLADALVCPQTSAGGDACGSCPACRQAAAGSHPDQHRVTPEQPGKAIRIDAIRALTGKSFLSAQEGGYRVFVIDPAEAMNTAAANAVLKTLEEPTARSVLVLVSSHPDRLPATIRSRCQLLRFRPPPAAEVRDWLGDRFAGEGELDGLMAISAGAPLRALQAHEEGWIDADGRLAGELADLKRRKVNPIQTVEEWEKRPLTQIIDGLKRLAGDLVRLASRLNGPALHHPGLRSDLQSLGQDIDLQELFAFNDALLKFEREAARNLNPSMLLETIVNRWLQITRPGGQ